MKNSILFLGAIVLLLSISFSTTSCKKSNEAPVVTIDEPTDGSTITLPDSTHIEGKLTDDAGLHEASVLVLNALGDTALAEYPYVHDLKTYSYHYHFHPSVVGTYTVKVTAEDHKSASTTKTVTFTVL